MNKVYILVPLLGVLIFAGAYWNFNTTYKEKIATRIATEQAAVKAKQKADIVAREQAIKDAIASQERRKIERDAKEKKDVDEKQARLDLEDKRTRTFEEMKRARELVDRLKKDLSVVQDDIKKLEEERKRHLDEQTFLKTFVKKAETNAKYYYDLLDKLAAAEAAAAEAAKAAAAAAAKKG